MTGSPIKNRPSRLLGSNALSLCAIALCSTSVAAAQPASEPNTNSQSTVFTVTVERPVLQLGNKGESVSELQAVLKLLGYYTGSVDGIYSEVTAQAVSKFQADVGLNSDGIVGRETWSRLFPATSTPTIPSPSANLSQGSTTTPSQGTESPNLASSGKGGVDFPILKMGTRGVAVTNLQERLRSKGFFRGSVDGVFGPQTYAAVKAVQQQYQLPTDGVVGPATWKVLLR